MEEIENVERLAEENSELAKVEKESAIDMKHEAELTVKRAKAREMLVENEIELTKIRERLAEKTKKLVGRKEKVKELLKFGDEGLKIEKSQAIYNERVAEIQIKIAEIQRKIANVETEIAEVKVKLANKKLHEAKDRDNLAKKLFAYVKLMRESAPNEKISKAEEAYLKIQKDLANLETDVMEIHKSIIGKQNKLADLKKDHSAKLAEREKIRPITFSSQ